MSKLEILKEIFPAPFFKPYVKIDGKYETYYAISTLRFTGNNWSWATVELSQDKLRKHNASMGVDFDKKAFVVRFRD